VDITMLLYDLSTIHLQSPHEDFDTYNTAGRHFLSLANRSQCPVLPTTMSLLFPHCLHFWLPDVALALETEDATSGRLGFETNKNE
jgi:hypothetical protein